LTYLILFIGGNAAAMGDRAHAIAMVRQYLCSRRWRRVVFRWTDRAVRVSPNG
jgi:hypothetical protein